VLVARPSSQKVLYYCYMAHAVHIREMVEEQNAGWIGMKERNAAIRSVVKMDRAGREGQLKHQAGRRGCRGLDRVEVRIDCGSS